MVFQHQEDIVLKKQVVKLIGAHMYSVLNSGSRDLEVSIDKRRSTVEDHLHIICLNYVYNEHLKSSKKYCSTLTTNI